MSEYKILSDAEVDIITHDDKHEMCAALDLIWIKIQDIDYVKKYLSYKLPLNTYKNKPLTQMEESLLFKAISLHQEEIAMLLIENGADITFVDTYYGNNLIMHATRYRKFNIVKYCLEHNIDANHTNLKKQNVLFYIDNELDMIKLLVEKYNIDINCINNDGFTSLMHICTRPNNNNCDTISYYIENNANLSIIRKNNETAFHYFIKHAEVYSNCEKILNKFIDYGQILPLNNNDLNNIIIKLASIHQFSIIKIILTLGYQFKKDEFQILLSYMMKADIFDINDLCNLADKTGIMSMINKEFI